MNRGQIAFCKSSAIRICYMTPWSGLTNLFGEPVRSSRLWFQTRQFHSSLSLLKFPDQWLAFLMGYAGLFAKKNNPNSFVPNLLDWVVCVCAQEMAACLGEKKKIGHDHPREVQPKGFFKAKMAVHRSVADVIKTFCKLIASMFRVTCAET